ncbi:hypothetical protein [Clostridium disporicum]|uniref:Uncharacterized protein n=1 Tax=Clostridium disporicum TaxID=84024 RepID=A0A173XT40_9CLOT|nr:hypothetical protein [Clostridium disporicum]CUN54126.1 Uncharacterised protein [Clostridium disporicum]
MAYDKLIKETNMKNGIEGNISVFMRERVEGKEDGAKVIANVIAGSLDRNYKGQNNYKLLAKKITDKDNSYFEDIAAFAIYIFTMDYTNKMLKDMPEDHNRNVLMKAISTQISRGVAAINMYVANDIKQGVYATHTETTRKIMGISNKFHDAFNNYLNSKKSEIIENLIAI